MNEFINLCAWRRSCSPYSKLAVTAYADQLRPPTKFPFGTHPTAPVFFSANAESPPSQRPEPAELTVFHYNWFFELQLTNCIPSCAVKFEARHTPLCYHRCFFA